MSEFQDATDPLKRLLEEAAREAFDCPLREARSPILQPSPDDPSDYGARCYLEGDAARQVESFVRLAAMADQSNLTDE